MRRLARRLLTLRFTVPLAGLFLMWGDGCAAPRSDLAMFHRHPKITAMHVALANLPRAASDGAAPRVRRDVWFGPQFDPLNSSDGPFDTIIHYEAEKIDSASSAIMVEVVEGPDGPRVARHEFTWADGRWEQASRPGTRPHPAHVWQ